MLLTEIIAELKPLNSHHDIEAAAEQAKKVAVSAQEWKQLMEIGTNIIIQFLSGRIDLLRYTQMTDPNPQEHLRKGAIYTTKPIELLRLATYLGCPFPDASRSARHEEAHFNIARSLGWPSVMGVRVTKNSWGRISLHSAFTAFYIPIGTDETKAREGITKMSYAPAALSYSDRRVAESTIL